ncbi:MAG: hypothetical protein EGR83_17225 [Bacteroides cellulosilyticus]|nr:hypothetical protein [Bacteroides cellulosilyticus]
MLLPCLWHNFAIVVAQHCHAYGTTVPKRWQESGTTLRFRQRRIPGRLKLQGSKMIRQEE